MLLHAGGQLVTVSAQRIRLICLRGSKWMVLEWLVAVDFIDIFSPGFLALRGVDHRN